MGNVEELFFQSIVTLMPRPIRVFLLTTHCASLHGSHLLTATHGVMMHHRIIASHIMSSVLFSGLPNLKPSYEELRLFRGSSISIMVPIKVRSKRSESVPVAAHSTVIRVLTCVNIGTCVANVFKRVHVHICNFTMNLRR